MAQDAASALGLEKQNKLAPIACVCARAHRHENKGDKEREKNKSKKEMRQIIKMIVKEIKGDRNR